MRLLLLSLHIIGGIVALIAGTAAVAARKGGRLHRSVGNIFTIAMLMLAASGLILAIMKSQRGNVIGSIITFYMISTGWLAGRRPGSGPLNGVAFVAGLSGAAAATAAGFLTLHNPASDKSAPAGMSFFFAAVLLLAAAGDLRMMVRGGLSTKLRMVRHLWRMCFGLFIATGSFFLGQQQVFPAFLRGSIFLTILALLPLPLLIYWLIRVRFGREYSTQSPVQATAVLS